ncbi:PfkB family carbohydrate kinase [Cellulosimicrobium sp. TH-20]|uniref:PfkB family carbohydrate kinase n=2 Tax=Cellulosimicrobium TaxID=157920 RepID=UPI001643F53B|nr:PfkB family carbohydrate kinase [Cellulosimicrobium sp. TH-20]
MTAPRTPSGDTPGAGSGDGPHDAARRWLRAHADDLHDGLDLLTAEAGRIDAWGARLADTVLAGGRLLVAGNGGSAAEAQHLTAELVGRFDGERTPLSAISLHAETSSLTAIVNDYGIAEMYARQVAAHGRPGDVLVLLSTSGESENVVAAARRARELGLTTWALTGPRDCALAAACDDVLALRGASTSSVQELHLVVVHALCAALDAHVRHREAHAAADLPGAGSAEDRPAPAPVPASAAATGPQVVVVGDVLLDRDVDGQVTRFSPDGPVPVVDTLGVRRSPGGAGLTALLAADGASVRLVAPFGDDDAGTELRALLRPHLDVVALPQVGTTRRKTRVRSGGQTVVRVDDGGPARPGDLPERAARAALAGADVVLVSDYGAGTTHAGPVRDALAHAARTGTLVWDPHPRGGAPVPGTALVTPNLAEALDAAEALGVDATPDDPGGLARSLAAAWDVGAVCVTAGDRGAFVARADGEPAYVPATVAHGDPCGAGDRFASTVAVALARGEGLVPAVVAAVASASAWVAAGGAEGYRRRADSPADRTPGAAREHAPDRASGAPTPSGATQDVPPSDPDGPEAVAARLRAAGGTVVATGGCFDILHAGHVATLEAAARLGDHLVVLLNGDASVRRLKGPQRPVVGQADRARVLAALDCVAAVVVFDEDDPRAALDRLRPDVWAKGGDYTEETLPEAETVRRHGGRVVVLPYIDGRSTTSILERSGRFAPGVPTLTEETTA